MLKLAQDVVLKRPLKNSLGRISPWESGTLCARPAPQLDRINGIGRIKKDRLNTPETTEDPIESLLENLFGIIFQLTPVAFVVSPILLY
jgi:hypothetical protein